MSTSDEGMFEVPGFRLRELTDVIARLRTDLAAAESRVAVMRKRIDVYESWLWRWQAPPEAMTDLRAALSGGEQEAPQ